MTTIQQNLLNPNNQPLVIGEFSIRQDEDGRYCLNDLHKASGYDKKHQPAYFIRNQQTKDLIAEIENPSNGASANLQMPAVGKVNDGKNNGTYVVKELVYSYAMWIFAKFHLMVIRAYDAMVMQWKINDRQSISPEQQALLHEIVSRRSEGERKIYAEMWSRHNKHFRITRYSDLLAIHFQDAVNYLETLEIKSKGSIYIDEKQSLEMLCVHARFFQAWWYTHSPALAKLNPLLVTMLNDNMFSMSSAISDVSKKCGFKIPNYDYDHMFELQTLPHARYRLLK
ncbi:KilA-N domain-containing protein [Acinetobacter sp. ANC 4945]|uniref:KilA-N domain-containing protein n=1 Tax=Acinetobacter amyesii TaxID=2942470 RepID=A0A1T1GUE6_9GAMM|nr:KilA-N domain-containing protein [Acinetobacter amyesii]MCL6248029.1 KilA-N domain-containing protein [Acinetobacter amyesii]OOV81236.1 hypothetical protein B1202_11810 [Acinetobacter amyesii]